MKDNGIMPTIKTELKNYTKEEFIEEIARLRLIVFRGNVEAIKLTKEECKKEELEFLKEKTNGFKHRHYTIPSCKKCRERY